MFNKKTKEIKYTEHDMYAVKDIMRQRSYAEEMVLMPFKTAKDYGRAIELCTEAINEIAQFERKHSELDDMFSFEKELFKQYKKVFYLKLEEMEKSAE